MKRRKARKARKPRERVPSETPSTARKIDRSQPQVTISCPCRGDESKVVVSHQAYVAAVIKCTWCGSKLKPRIVVPEEEPL